MTGKMQHYSYVPVWTNVLNGGEEGMIHIDHILEYNQESGYMIDLLSYNLSVVVRKCIERSAVSKREIIRRLETSPTHF